MSRDALVALLSLVALGVVIGVLLSMLGRAALDLDGPWRRLGRRAPPRPRTSIEDVAASIARLSAELDARAPGRTWVKTDAVRRAYDDALVEGCLALGVETDLATLDDGVDRAAERMRVEHELTAAGLIRTAP